MSCEDSFSISHLEIQFIRPEINGPNISSRQLTILPQIQFARARFFFSFSVSAVVTQKTHHFAHNLSQCKINDTPKLNPRFDMCANNKHKWQTKNPSEMIHMQIDLPARACGIFNRTLITWSDHWNPTIQATLVLAAIFHRFFHFSAVHFPQKSTNRAVFRSE